MSGLTSGLYPFLDDDEHDPAPVLANVRESTLRKAADVSELRRALWERSGDALVWAARLTAEAFDAGGKLLAFGNGGSATDAQDLVADLTRPALPEWAPLPALCLVDDRGVLTAVANDVGFAEVFARQVIAYGEAGDVAVGFSTSGRSGNVLEGLREARSRGIRTVGFAGYEGGEMAEAEFMDAVIVAPSTHIPRIQEAHATAYHTLLLLVHELLGPREVSA